MRHRVVLGVLGLLIVLGATNGIAALAWTSNSGCADFPGTRDADVSVQVVPFGLVCDYEADSTGPAERVVRAASFPWFAAWLFFVGVVVAAGIWRRALPPARGLVSAVCVLGLFGLLATFWEMSGAMAASVVFGIVLAAVVDLWLWSGRGRWWSLLGCSLFLPSAVIAAWFAPGLYGWEALAAALGLAVGAVVASVFSRDWTLSSPPRMGPLR